MKALQLKVGLLIVVALSILAGFVAMLGNFSLRSGYRLYIDFDYSGNLQSGAAVKISGIKVGKVEEVQFWAGKVDEETKPPRRVQVRVVAWVEERAKDAIRGKAEFWINQQGVLGEQYLEIRPGSFEDPPLPAGSKVVGVNPPRTDLIVAKLYEFLESITNLLREDKDVIRDFLKSGASVVRTLDTILKDNQPQIARLLVNVDALTREASQLLASLRNGVGDAKSLRATLDNVEARSAAVRKDIDPVLQKTKKALDGINNLTSIVGPTERDKLVKTLDQIVTVGDKVQRLATDSQALVADVRKGKGTAGALLVDQQVYDDVKEMVRDLKRNPWKFFWKE
jgi:phospholipid/cholesterol/gamma-HCH transport system substrate-binding protein